MLLLKHKTAINQGLKEKGKIGILNESQIKQLTFLYMKIHDYISQGSFSRIRLRKQYAN